MKFFGRKKASEIVSAGAEPGRSADRSAPHADRSSPHAVGLEWAANRTVHSEAEAGGNGRMQQAAGSSRTSTAAGAAAVGRGDYSSYSRYTTAGFAAGSTGSSTMSTSSSRHASSQQQHQQQAPASTELPRRVTPAAAASHGSYGLRANGAGGFVSESEDDGCTSDADIGASFNRGSRARASLPVMTRSTSAASSSGGGDPQLGIIFLTYNGITRKSLLPRIITGMDSVRALFLRTFPQLTVQHLESPASKIYIHERMSNRFYVLTHLSDVRDGIMLKLVVDAETTPVMKRSQSAYSNSSSRDSAYASSIGSEGSYRVQVPAPHRTTFATPSRETSVDDLHDGQMPGAARQQQQRPEENLSQPAAQKQYTPQHRQIPAPAARIHAGFTPSFTQFVPPVGTGNDPRTRHSYSTPTNHFGTLPRSLPKPSPAGSGTDTLPWQQAAGGSRASAGASSATSFSTDIDAVDAGLGQDPDPGTQHRMAKMESQLANLTAWVQTTLSRPSSAMSDKISDVSSGSARSASTPTQPELTADAQSKVHRLAAQAKDLRTEVRNLRRIHQAQAESVRDTISDVLGKIKLAISRVPGADEYPIRAKRDQADESLARYRQDVQKLDIHLSDLEKCVEKLKADVVNRRVHIDLSEVEAMAGHLIATSKLAAEVKVKFPKVQSELTSAMTGELQLITEQDEYLRKEPDRIDESIKRIRQLTLTLSTLRRLAGVQDHRTPAIPHIQGGQFGEAEKSVLLGSIRSIVPNHEQRQAHVQTASLLLETKKALVTGAERVPFEKSMEQTGRYLKEAEGMGRPPVDNAMHLMLQQVKSAQQRMGPRAASSGGSSTPRATSSEDAAAAATQPLVSLRRQLNHRDRNKLIQNRDSVHWDADSGSDDSERGSPSSANASCDDPFVDVTEEPVRTSAFSPIGKCEPLNVRDSMHRDLHGSAAAARGAGVLKPAATQASSTVDYVPVRDIGPSSPLVGPGIGASPRSQSAHAEMMDDVAASPGSFERQGSISRKQMEGDSRMRLYDQHNKLQKLHQQYVQNGSASVSRDPVSAESRSKASVHTPKPLPAPKPALKTAMVNSLDGNLALDLEYTRSTTV